MEHTLFCSIHQFCLLCETVFVGSLPNGCHTNPCVDNSRVHTSINSHVAWGWAQLLTRECKIWVQALDGTQAQLICPKISKSMTGRANRCEQYVGKKNSLNEVMTRKRMRWAEEMVIAIARSPERSWCGLGWDGDNKRRDADGMIIIRGCGGVVKSNGWASGGRGTLGVLRTPHVRGRMQMRKGLKHQTW